MITERTIEKPVYEAPAEGTKAAKSAALASAGRQKRRGSRLRLLGFGTLTAATLTGALAVGTLPRLRQEQQLEAATATAAAARPLVTVAVAQRMAANAERVLPGNSFPLLEASIYARTTGYLKSRRVDIGDRVREGQLLAEIATPDVDAQLAQAKANLTLARANLPLAEANAELAKVTLDRDTKAGAGTATSWEQIDQDKAQVKVTAAQVEAARASVQVNEAAVQRYSELQGFQKIIAPFPGVITARNVDAGDLISADTPNTTKELFHLMRTDVLRVFVNVPQAFATGIKVDESAAAFLRDDPAKQFPGKVTRTADALDPNTRTLLTEVDVSNPDNVLRPGMYLQVKFVFDRNIMPVMIPAAALATRSGAPRVAVLDGQQRVQYRSVQLGRDFGAEIAVTTGLKAGDSIVVHPGDDIPQGTVVEAVPLAK
ncbi:MAG: efflux RND transporter periplasmic adaptor subunit [Thermoguttaceae bacterium]|jgi:RND family efflux transporter MFP subunit